MHLSKRFLNSLLFYTEFCSPYNLYVTGVFKVRGYIYSETCYRLLEVSFYISTTWWVSRLVDKRVPEGTCSQILWSTLVIWNRFESIKIILIKTGWNCNFVGLSDQHFQNVKPLCLAKDHWWGFITQNAHIWSNLLIESDLKWCIHFSRSLFLYFNYLVSVTAGGPVKPRRQM